MEFNEYQKKARSTAIYIDNINNRVIYPTLGLTGEAGEVAEKVKKSIRDHGGELDVDGIAQELGDVLWYVANLAEDIGFSLEQIAEINLKKLKSRKQRNKIHGEGDNR